MPVSLPQSPTGNRLLDALPADERVRVLPQLEQISFSPAEVVYEAGGRMEYVYFPTNSIIYSLYIVASGATVETCVVGNEGVVGTALFMGGDTSPYRAVVQTAGGAVRMGADVLREEFARGGAFQQLLLSYTQALMVQISQTAVCNRLHTVEQQLCRLLLLSHDRARSNELLMTQELIANMLGVRREGVTYAAQRLQVGGLIRYIRGHIRILDRKGLETAVCECYQVVENEFSRLLDQRFERAPLTGTHLSFPQGRGRRRVQQEL